jgi:hypothetical protein
VKLIRDKTKFYITDLKREINTTISIIHETTAQGPRTYNVGEKKIPSVTTILSATQSKEKREALDKWRERVGYQEAQAITQKACT